MTVFLSANIPQYHLYCRGIPPKNNNNNNNNKNKNTKKPSKLLGVEIDHGISLK